MKKHYYFIIIIQLALNNYGISQNSPQNSTSKSPQEITLRLQNGKTIQVNTHYEDGYYIYQGDIILGKGKKRLKGVEYVIGDNWDCGIIPYTLNSNLNSDQLSIINEAISQINNNTNLSLKVRSNEIDYVDFISSPTDRCLSKVGRVGQRQEIEISSDGCSLWGRVAHEIFHAAGIWHEHARIDRDNFITVHLNNVDPENWDQFDILPGTEDIGPYDYNSIMHYGSKAFSTNGANTITTPNGEQIGNRVNFSNGDINTINTMYDGCPAGFFGKVRDHENKVLEGASVYLINSKGTLAYNTTTDLKGNYNIDNIFPGTYDIVYIHPSYPNVEFKDILFRAGVNLPIDIRMGYEHDCTESGSKTLDGFDFFSIFGSCSREIISPIKITTTISPFRDRTITICENTFLQAAESVEIRKGTTLTVSRGSKLEMAIGECNIIEDD